MARGGGGGGRGGGGRGGYGRGGGGRGASGGGADLNAALDALDEEMLYAFQGTREIMMGTWSQFAGNEGQLTIVHNYIIPASQDFMSYAKEEWPYTGEPDEYVSYIMESYDPEVIERAFSDTLYGIYDEIAGIWGDAMTAQDNHNSLMGRIVAHSTNPPWTA